MKAKSRVSKTAPAGWPTKAEWGEVEKKLTKIKPSRVLPANASAVDRAKQELCTHFVRYCQKEGISQRELARVLGVTESRVSEIVHYHHGRFTIDRLLELLSIIRPKVKFNVA